MKGLPTNEEIVAAIKNLAMTTDGLLLRRYCQLEVNRIATPQEIACGALQFSEGRRSFAREIASLMDARLAESAVLERSADPAAPVVRQPAGKPVASRDPARRRVPPYSSGSGKA